MIYVVLKLTKYSVNCRLPQTPRTPSIGMSHYFDDILHRHVGGMQTPKSPMMSPTAPRLRRSSTTRSLAARSDFDTNDLNGYEEEADGSFPTRRGSVAPSMFHDPEKKREREAADEHLHTYISQQLERVRLEQAENGNVEPDEFEAQVSE